MIALLFLLQLPPEVQAAQDIRADFGTAHIVARDADGDRYELDYAGGTFLVKRSEGRHLVKEGEVWTHFTKTVTAMQEHDTPNKPMGLLRWGFRLGPLADTLKTQLYRAGARTYEIDDCESTAVGAINYVTCKQSSNEVIEWALDTEKDFQPISVVLSRNGEHLRSAHSTLETIDGHWIPTSVAYFEGDDERTATIEEVSFDREDHRQEPFDAYDLGIGVGHQFSVLLDPAERPIRRWWNGESRMTSRDMWDLLAFHDIPVHPEVVAAKAREFGLTIKEELQQRHAARVKHRLRFPDRYAEILRRKAERPKDEWDVYTESFIREHKLNEPKQTVAMKILERSKTMRDVYRDKQTVSSEQEKYDAIEKHIFDRLLVRNLKRLIK